MVYFTEELVSGGVKGNNWDIERGLVTHPDDKFSTINDSLNQFACVNAGHGRDIDTRRSITACVSTIFYLSIFFGIETFVTSAHQSASS